MHNTLRRTGSLLRVLTGRQAASRGLTVFPDDTFLVSYPRSGNTWTRFLVSNLVYAKEATTFLNIESRVPNIYDHADRILRGLPRPRFLKSHECFEPRYRRVIYIVRDPRDVAVSYYYFNIKQRNIPEGYSLELHIERWMKPEWGVRYGTWGEHVKSWLGVRGQQDGFLLVRYEDVHADPYAELKRIASFLELDRSGEQIAQAIELSSASRMRNLEKRQQGQWIQTKHSRLDKPFIRKAVVGDWAEVLPEGSVTAIEGAWGGIMRTLGYELRGQAHAGEQTAKELQPR